MMNKLSNLQMFFGQLIRREYTIEELEQRLNNPNLDTPEIKSSLKLAIQGYKRLYKSYRRS